MGQSETVINHLKRVHSLMFGTMDSNILTMANNSKISICGTSEVLLA